LLHGVAELPRKGIGCMVSCATRSEQYGFGSDSPYGRNPPSGFPGWTDIRLCGTLLQSRKAFSPLNRFSVRRNISAAFVDFHFNTKGLS
jgi:hypothetical protein